MANFEAHFTTLCVRGVVCYVLIRTGAKGIALDRRTRGYTGHTLVVCQMGNSSTGMVSPIAGEYLRQHERLPHIQLTLTNRQNNEGIHCHLSLTLFSYFSHHRLFVTSPQMKTPEHTWI